MEYPEIGDIIAERAFDFWTNFSQFILPKTALNWPSGRKPKLSSIHNAIVGKRGDVLGIFESSPGRCVHFVSWDHYLEKVRTKKVEAKILRVSSSEVEKQKINQYLNNQLDRGSLYDMLGAFSLFLDFTLRRPLIHQQVARKYYCTELVAKTFKHISKNFLGNLPTPYDIEREVAKGHLKEVANLY